MRIGDISKLSLKQMIFIIITSILAYQILGKRLVENQNYYNLAVFLLWLVSALLLSPRTFINTMISKKSFLFGFFLIYIMLTGAFSGDYSSTLKYIFGFTIVVSPIIICDYIITYGNKQISKLILFISLAILSYYSIMTNVMIHRYPTIARQLASGSDDIMNFYYGLNIGGGYSLVYGLVFLILVLFIKFKNDKSKNKIFLPFIILFTATLINSGYFIAIAITFAGLIITCFNKGKIKNFILIIIFFILLLTSIVMNVPKQIGNSMISYSLNHDFLLDSKVLEIGNMLSGNKLYDYENVEGRTARIRISVHSFMNHPLIGNGRDTGYNSASEAGIIGQHSEWLDALARYGILGVTILLAFFISSMKALFPTEKYAVIPFAAFIMLGFLNPILNFSIFYVLFLIQKLVQENSLAKTCEP